MIILQSLAFDIAANSWTIEESVLESLWKGNALHEFLSFCSGQLPMLLKQRIVRVE